MIGKTVREWLAINRLSTSLRFPFAGEQKAQSCDNALISSMAVYSQIEPEWCVKHCDSWN
jgi:hypothetical protein